MSGLLERDVERALSEMVRARGGLSRKWVSPGHSGVPDRIAMLPGGRVVFFEVKRPGGRLSRLQAAEIRRLRRMGCEVHVVSSREEAAAALDGGDEI